MFTDNIAYDSKTDRTYIKIDNEQAKRLFSRGQTIYFKHQGINRFLDLFRAEDIEACIADGDQLYI